MLSNIEAVIFDLDGTLVDSMWLWKQIDIDYLGEHGYELPPNLQQEIEGMSFSETAVYFKEHFKISDSLDEIKNRWNCMAKELYRTKVGFKNGAREFVSFLRDNGIKTGIATSNSKELLETVLDALNAGHLFDSKHVSCEVSKGKPAPDIYLLVAEELNVKPEKCLVFEDISQGVRAGKNAGMKVCGIKDTYAEMRKDNVREIADYYIEDFFDIEQFANGTGEL